MALAIHSNEVVSDASSLRHATKAAFRSTTTITFHAAQAVPAVIANTAAAAVAVVVVGLVAAAAIWSVGVVFNAIMPKSYKEYKKRTGS